MDIDTLIQQLSSLGEAFVGKGPKHPTSPRPEIQPEISSLLTQYPFLEKDQGYVDYLEHYAGAVVDRPSGDLFISIFGLDEDVSLHLTRGEGPIVDNEGFFTFCDSVVRDQEQNDIGLGYVFDATGERRKGVYIVTEDSSEPHWYCESFLQWLADIIQKEGKLA